MAGGCFGLTGVVEKKPARPAVCGALVGVWSVDLRGDRSVGNSSLGFMCVTLLTISTSLLLSSSNWPLSKVYLERIGQLETVELVI